MSSAMAWRSPTSSCRSASAATWHCSPVWAGCCWRRRTQRRARSLDRDFIETHCAGFDEYERQTRAVDLDTVTEATGVPLAQLRAGGAMLIALGTHRVLLGDGPDPASPCRRHHRRGHQSAADARHDRQTRRRSVSGARALQCPGRPHDGHLGEDARSVPGRTGSAVRDQQSAQARLSTPSTRSAPCATVAPRRSSAWAATSPRPHPDTEVTEAALRGCALTVQISTKLNRSHVVHGRTALILPTLGPHRPRHPGRRKTACLCGRFDVRWCTCRAAACTRPAMNCAVRSPSSANWPARFSVPIIRCHGNDSPTTTTSSATPSPTSYPGAPTTTLGYVSPTGSAPPPAA